MGMEPFVTADANAFGPLVGSIPNPLQEYEKQLAFRSNLDAQRAETEERQAAAAEAQQKIIQQQEFKRDLETISDNPTAANISGLILKHPEFAKEVKSAWDLKDKAIRDADLTQMSEIYSAAAAGKYDVAAKSMQMRIDADKASGHEDPTDQAILDALNSGDPVKQKGALGLIGTHLAAVTGAEHFGTVYGALKGGYTLEAGATRYDENNNITAQSPYLKTPGGGIIERDNPGAPSVTGGSPPAVTPRSHGYTPRQRDGGDNSDAVVDSKIEALSKATGVDPDTPMNAQQFAAFAQALPATEGGPGTLSGQQNNPGAIKDGAFAKSQPGYAGANKGYAVFKTPQAGTAAMQKLLTNRYYNRGQQSIRDIIEGRPTGQRQAAQPQPSDAPPGYHTLIPGKPKDAPAGFRWTADGNLEKIPGGPADQEEEGFDPQAVEFSAQQYLATGQMPTLGMGKAAAHARKQIIERAAKIAGADGLTGSDFAQQISHYKAATQALKTLETQAGTVEQNEKTALANGQQFIDRSKELSGQTNYPAINSITQSYLRHTGDPTVAAMDTAWNTFTTEYAKVVAGSPSGAGTLSDSARREAQDTMRGNYSFQQKLSAFKQMQADMANRIAAIHETITGKYDTLTKNPRKAAEIAAQTDLGGASSPKADLPKGAKVIGTHNGKRVILLNGKRMVEQ